MARKEVRPVHLEHACDVCGRSMLKGESLEPWIAPGGERKMVCELCPPMAARHGWVRESAAGELPPTTRRPEPRRSLLSRFRPGGEAEGVQEGSEPAFAGPPEGGAEPLPTQSEASASYDASGTPLSGGAHPGPRRRREREDGGGLREKLAGTVGVGGGRRREPRHVRAVPTNQQAKIERAIELFNDSEEPRTIAGISRSLGEPWVIARPLDTQPHEVLIVVAWELSWYRYRVDLGDADQPVMLLEKGDELDQLDEPKGDPNVSVLSDGRLVIGVGSQA
jgi:hypothetical protein